MFYKWPPSILSAPDTLKCMSIHLHSVFRMDVRCHCKKAHLSRDVSRFNQISNMFTFRIFPRKFIFVMVNHRVLVVILYLKPFLYALIKIEYEKIIYS